MANPTGKRGRKHLDRNGTNGRFKPLPTLNTFPNEKGYLRYSNGPNKGKYVHRIVIEQLLGHPIPAHMTVHHSDHVRTHNCPGNLQLLDKAIHDVLSRSHLTFLQNNPEMLSARIQEEYDSRTEQIEEMADSNVVEVGSIEEPDWLKEAYEEENEDSEPVPW